MAALRPCCSACRSRLRLSWLPFALLVCAPGPGSGSSCFAPLVCALCGCSAPADAPPRVYTLIRVCVCVYIHSHVIIYIYHVLFACVCSSLSVCSDKLSLCLALGYQKDIKEMQSDREWRGHEKKTESVLCRSTRCHDVIV